MLALYLKVEAKYLKSNKSQVYIYKTIVHFNKGTYIKLIKRKLDLCEHLNGKKSPNFYQLQF